MGKNFCKVEGKWCKFLRRGVCNYCNADITTISRCPRVESIETIRFCDLLSEVEFEDVFSHIYDWYENQRNCKEAYLKVFNNIRSMKPKKHNLDDLFISVEATEEDGEIYPDVYGHTVVGSNAGRNYCIEFVEWNDWISMYITKETLNTFTKEQIVAACMYEMTFSGFEEEKVQETLKRMTDSIKNMVEENKKK